MKSSVKSRSGMGGILSIFLGIPLVIFGIRTLSRMVHREEKLPVPVWRKVLPPEVIAARYGIKPGMIAMEIGPGTGEYAIVAAHHLGNNGRLIAIDPREDVIESLRRQARQLNVRNIEGRQAEYTNLPFNEGSFDLVYMISKIGGIADPIRVMGECKRILSKTGTLVFSECVIDPHYPPMRDLIKLGQKAGFRLKNYERNILSYTLVFEKDV